jgi:Na+/H+-dicarboxylate symporter
MTVLLRLFQFLLAVFALLTAAQFVMTLGSEVVGPVGKVALLVVAAACLWACIAPPRLVARKRASH